MSKTEAKDQPQGTIPVEDRMVTLRKEIAERILAKNAAKPCSQCGAVNFSIVDGFFAPTINRKFGAIELGGQNIPLAVLICENCGHTVLHALGSLGLLPQQRRSGPDRP